MSISLPSAPGAATPTGESHPVGGARPLRALVAIATLAILLVALFWAPEWRSLRAVLTVLAVLVVPTVWDSAARTVRASVAAMLGLIQKTKLMM